MNGLFSALSTNKYKYDNPDSSILETFPVPETQGDLSINITVPEFTSLCPITGQPSFATITIEYVPDRSCVESKSIKLYLMAFRNYKTSNEACVAKILNDFINVVDPWSVTVKSAVTTKEGIFFNPIVTYERFT